VAAWLLILGERHDEILHEVNVHAVDVSNKTRDMAAAAAAAAYLAPGHFSSTQTRS
jgi:hypothetical protein